MMIAALALAACGLGGQSNASNNTKGPIKIWYSNNAQEVQWGAAMVSAWNQQHPKEQVSGEQIPAGKTSEEVIGAAITAGTTPCLIYNTAPAAVLQFQKQGGLVDLSQFSGANSFIESRTGARAKQYRSPDGGYYQMPWKTNPVMIFYNKDLFQKAGLDPEHPQLNTYDQFLTTSEQLVAKGVRAAIWPSPTSEFFQPWFDYYPLFIAQTKGKQLVENGQPQFDNSDGIAVAQFLRQMYAKGLAPKEAAQGDAFGTGEAAMASFGPAVIAQYSNIHWGVVPVPTKDGVPADQVHTFSDEKSVGMYSSCKNKGTAWDFLEFTMSQDNDGKLLSITGQMPMRTNLPATYPSYFQAHQEYKVFADQAARTVEVPNVPNSTEIWQEFRNEYSKAVIFGSEPIDQALKQAADKIKQLAGSK
ncbi:MAG: sugar ABC transporter substrate-binding protein [Candidatus Dormibacteraeota bacterium]|nr:sugar ABC transporter substrate-binding protein [Candidatus Dormibacteraeota bacterium]